MTDDLSILPESVRESIDILEAYCEGTEFWLTPSVQDVIGELLRLAQENAVLRDAIDAYESDAVAYRDRIGRAEAELSKFTR